MMLEFYHAENVLMLLYAYPGGLEMPAPHVVSLLPLGQSTPGIAAQTHLWPPAMIPEIQHILLS